MLANWKKWRRRTEWCRGVKILMEYAKVDENPVLRMGCTESTPLWHEHLKICCGIYIHNPAREFTQLLALSYGWQCDGFLVLSTVTIPSLGETNIRTHSKQHVLKHEDIRLIVCVILSMAGLLHRGEEAYRNTVQKIRSIWSYISTHYLDQFDSFRIGGDDMHVVAESREVSYLSMKPQEWMPERKVKYSASLAQKEVGLSSFVEMQNTLSTVLDWRSCMGSCPNVQPKLSNLRKTI